jgi:hypothetical protein
MSRKQEQEQKERWEKLSVIATVTHEMAVKYGRQSHIVKTLQAIERDIRWAEKPIIEIEPCGNCGDEAVHVRMKDVNNGVYVCPCGCLRSPTGFFDIL